MGNAAVPLWVKGSDGANTDVVGKVLESGRSNTAGNFGVVPEPDLAFDSYG
jgi:hypothetical protein